MTSPLDGLFPIVAQRAAFAVYVGQVVGLQPQITSGFRSLQRQAQLRAQYDACLTAGETITSSNPNAACRYPANAPGDSAHNFGLAWDSWVPDGQWDAWTSIRTQLGFNVPDNDRVHAEVPDWRAVAAVLIQLGMIPGQVAAPVAATAPATVSGPISTPAISQPTPAPVPAPAAPAAPSKWQLYTTAPPGSWACNNAIKTHPAYDVWCAGVKVS